MARLRLGKYLSGPCVAWVVCLACHAATTNAAGLLAVRFFLEAAEASISPGFSLITGMYYRRKESVAVMFAFLFPYGIAHIHRSIAPWRVSVTTYVLQYS